MMHVIEVFRDRNVAYVCRYSEHLDSCSQTGRVPYPEQTCNCPSWATNLEVSLEKVEAQTGRLPDGYQHVVPWPEIEDV